MRSSFSGALVLLWLAACGASELDADERGYGPEPAVCDVRALAQSMLFDSLACPPANCWIDGRTEKVSCQGSATASGGQACTRFIDVGGTCPTLCAPPSCTLSLNGSVVCSDGCSVEDTTCFAVAEDLCPGSN